MVAKGSIVVYYGVGASILYAEEAWRRGLNFIAVYPNDYDKKRYEQFKKEVGKRPVKYVFLKGDGTKKEKAIDELKKEKIVCAAIGTENGVRNGDKFFSNLGFKLNNPSTTENRTTKKGMDSALKKAGIRHILTTVVKSESDIRKFWKDNKLDSGFMKFSESAGTVGNKVCYSVDEAIEHFKLLSKSKNMFGRKSDILLQEHIGGIEYVVNSVNCKEKHLITDIWRSNKIYTPDNDIVYDTYVLMDELEPGMYDLINYAHKVITATGFEHGFCHGEYKIDDKGPVLVETNARIMGPLVPMWFLDENLTSHYSDAEVDAYFDKKMFEKRLSEPYRIKKHACHKFFIMYDELNANLHPSDILFKRMKTYRATVSPPIENKKVHYAKTTDMITSPIMILLNDTNDKNIQKDVEFVNRIEKNVDLICEKNIKPSKVSTNIRKILDSLPRNEETIVVTNDGVFISLYGKYEKTTINKNNKFDNLVYACTNSKKLSNTYEKFFGFTDMIRPGGYVIMVPEFVKEIPYGTKGVQILSHIADMKIEVPKMGDGNLMKATKNRVI